MGPENIPMIEYTNANKRFAARTLLSTMFKYLEINLG
jgi:hypothetical protein